MLLILGQVTSLFGNFILKFALSMYILDLTGSATIFAGILSMAIIPTILLSPLGGILADRANRRNIMVALDILSGLFVLSAMFVFSRSQAIFVISMLLVALSILGAFETPTVQACIPQMQTGDNIIKGNAVVNQVASLAYLIAPIFGSIMYTVFGLKLVMCASTLCFFLTAFFECFIKVSIPQLNRKKNIWSIIKEDFSISMRYICKEETRILKLLFLVAFTRFFVVGILAVGLPYLVRTILGLNAKYYGIVESTLAIATIMGSVLAGVLIGKLKISKLSTILACFGIFLIPVGVVFLFPMPIFSRYIVLVIAFASIQVAITIFSIFSVSIIQQKTPNNLIGKIMSYTSAVTICVQPIGQIAYGLLFDKFRADVSLVLLPTGVIVCIIGLLARNFFQNLEKESSYFLQEKMD